MILSPTQIESFEDTTPFGCNRRWYFERVEKREKGIISGGELGSAVHATLETFLRGGPQGGLHDLVLGAPGAVDWLLKLRPRMRGIEIPIPEGDLLLAGVPVIGYIDWLAELGEGAELGDHKTTSVIARYAKTPGQIKTSIQMNIYAAWVFDQMPVEVLRMTQDFFQTKGARKFLPVSCDISKPENAARVLEIEAIVEKMIKTSKATRPEDVKPNEKVCNIAYGCPHRAYCPRSGEFNMASLQEMFASTPSAPATPATKAPSLLDAFLSQGAETEKRIELVTQVPDSTVPAPVLPPDAPKSDPAAFTAPPPAIETPAPKRGPKRGPGRPKGSTNKEEPAPTAPASITKIWIRHSAKIGMPNYGSAGVEVEAEAIVHGSVEDARNSVSMQVRAAMLKELDVYTKKG